MSAEGHPSVPNESTRRTRRRWLLLGAVLVVGGLTVLIYYVVPGGDGLARALPPCIFHEVTGLHCPGCGMTRAVHDLLHGRVGDALVHNPLVVPLLPLIVFYVAWSALHWAALVGKAPPSMRLRWGWIFVGVIAVYWLLRNLPWWPFTWLAP